MEKTVVQAHRLPICLSFQQDKVVPLSHALTQGLPPEHVLKDLLRLVSLGEHLRKDLATNEIQLPLMVA